MILSEISQYIKENSRVTLQDIALHFDSDPESVRNMLAVLVRKERIERELLTDSCGSSCNKCDLATTEIYSWVE